MSSSDPTVSDWLGHMKDGDGEALRQLWDRYFEKLSQIAAAKVSGFPARALGGEDVAASVFESLWDGAQLGRFGGVQDRHELWWLLVSMTRRKAASHLRKEGAAKRGGSTGAVSLDQHDGSEFLELLSREPQVDDVLVLQEQLDQLLTRIHDPKARKIAVLLMQGHSPADIAEEVDLALSTVRRKIRLIRIAWREEARE